MRRAYRPLLAALLLAAGAACAPNPIIARDPIPPPSPAQAFVCDSPTYSFGMFYNTRCEPAPRPAVVRAKG